MGKEELDENYKQTMSGKFPLCVTYSVCSKTDYSEVTLVTNLQPEEAEPSVLEEVGYLSLRWQESYTGLMPSQ